jgi:hypothetical protein
MPAANPTQGTSSPVTQQQLAPVFEAAAATSSQHEDGVADVHVTPVAATQSRQQQQQQQQQQPLATTAVTVSPAKAVMARRQAKADAAAATAGAVTSPVTTKRLQREGGGHTQQN